MYLRNVTYNGASKENKDIEFQMYHLKKTTDELPANKTPQSSERVVTIKK